MGFLQRIWIQDTSSESKMYPDSVYMYDAGNFVGLLTQKGKGNGKQWAGFSVLSRVKTEERIEEILEPIDSFSVPMKFFSIEQYPAKIETSTLWIPGWKIQWKQQQPGVTEEASGSPQSQSSPLPSSPRPPSRQHKHQGQHQPSLPPGQKQRSPSFQHLPKSPSGKQEPLQQSLQNKSNTASKPKASLSSNPTFRGKPKQSIQEKSGAHLSQSSPNDRTSLLLLPRQTSQPSPYPPLPSALEESNRRPTSSSQNQSNSK